MVVTVLQFSDTGALVSAIQLGLNRSGFLSSQPDGIFGEKTKHAVIDFQKAFLLNPDGIVNERTLEYLERYIKGYYKKTIKKGDTLWQIAVSNGISLNSILTANPSIDPDNLLPGSDITVPYNFEIVPDNIPYSSYLVSLLIDGIHARYPLAKISQQGQSVMQKPLHSITIGNGNNCLFINAGFHANEYLNIPLVLKFTEEYLRAISENLSIESINAPYLFENTTLHVMPLVNPDGLDLVTEALKEGAFYDNAKIISADYPSIPFPTGWKANINGVDLNLQYPANWEKAREIKFLQGFTKPSPIEYVGQYPLSEPEAKTVYNYTKENNFRVILAFHSQGKIIYWKYDDFLPEGSREIGEALSAASGYPLELTPPDSSYAGYKDWFISEYNRPGYTVETGIGVNPLPLEQFEDIYKANKPLLVTALIEITKN